MMKLTLLLITVLFSIPSSVFAGEPWKGRTEVRPLELGLMSGVAIYGNEANWGILPSVAYLIKDHGFADDLDNRVWVELQLGPTFFSSANSTQTGLQHSLHLRWDFNFNEKWTFYGLGGFGGYGLPKSQGSSFTFHPRFGAGAEYQTKAPFLFRAEVSAEFIGLGVAFNF